MRRKLQSLLMLTLVLTFSLVGCADPAEGGASSSVGSASESQPSGSAAGSASTSVDGSNPLVEDLGNGLTAAVDGSIIGPWETQGLFVPTEATTTEITSYLIQEGTEFENEIVVLTAEEEGPTVFIIASVHGDEVAGYQAADRMKNMELASGTLYILSPANIIGAEYNRRHVYDDQDLNRSFPGKTDGTEAELIAHAIYQEVERIQPDLVFDLHEAKLKGENRDFLGSSLIFTSLDGMEDLYMDMYLASQDGELCSEPYKAYSPGPFGSVNHTITTELEIPVITVETYRGYFLERRIEDQMAVVGFALEHLGLV